MRIAMYVPYTYVICVICVFSLGSAILFSFRVSLFTFHRRTTKRLVQIYKIVLFFTVYAVYYALRYDNSQK